MSPSLSLTHPLSLLRLAAQAQNLKKAEGPKKLYVGSLHYSINEGILKTIFEPFGSVEKIQIMRDENGLSKGYAFVEVCTGLWCVCVWFVLILPLPCAVFRLRVC